MNDHGLAPVLRGPSILSVTGRYHGLGNRLRAVLGAYSLAQYDNRRFAYTWPVGKEFGSHFHDLWEFDALAAPTALPSLLRPLYPWRDHTLQWRQASAGRQRIWQIRTAHALRLPSGCTPWAEQLRSLQPVAGIRSDIAKFYNQHFVGKPYIGIMIRTNPIAHAETLRHSPLEWFLTRMTQIRDLHPKIPFYISADTSEAFRTVNNKFDGCFGLEEKGPYNSAPALAGSVLDLYMLAGSSHLIGPYYSSFPELAQSLAGPDLVLETSMTPQNTMLRRGTQLTSPVDPLKPHQRFSSPWPG